MANGLGVALKDEVGIEPVVTSPCHSTTIAFDIKPRTAKASEFAALTYYPERTTGRMAYLMLFPIGTSMRATKMNDPWLRDMRRDPERSLFGLIPNCTALPETSRWSAQSRSGPPTSRSACARYRATFHHRSLKADDAEIALGRPRVTRIVFFMKRVVSATTADLAHAISAYEPGRTSGPVELPAGRLTRLVRPRRSTGRRSYRCAQMRTTCPNHIRAL